MKKLILALCVFSPMAASADDWTPADSGFQLAVAGVQIVDWMQTRSFLNIHCEPPYPPGGCSSHAEWNPIIGPHPSMTRLNFMVGGAIAGHALISYFLPQPWRRIWQVTVLTVEVGFVARNFGVRLSMPWD